MREGCEEAGVAEERGAVRGLLLRLPGGGRAERGGPSSNADRAEDADEAMYERGAGSVRPVVEPGTGIVFRVFVGLAIIVVILVAVVGTGVAMFLLGLAR